MLGLCYQSVHDTVCIGSLWARKRRQDAMGGREAEEMKGKRDRGKGRGCNYIIINVIIICEAAAQNQSFVGNYAIRDRIWFTERKL